MKKAKSLLGYDTGGYTGNWNSSDGKLALLHKKELVLNKDDTKNTQGKPTGDSQKNVKVDPEHSKDSLFPTKTKEDDKSLF